MFAEAALISNDDNESASSSQPDEIDDFDRGHNDADESDEVLDFYRKNAAGSRFNLFAERGTGQRGANSTNIQTYRGVRQILEEDGARGG